MIYEIRTYDIQIGKLPSYLALFERAGYPILQRYAEPVGYFYNETGTLNRIHHIWRYPDRATRAAKRAQLYKDADWLRDFLPYALAHLARQTNRIFSLEDGSPDPVLSENDSGRIFELTQIAAPDALADLPDTALAMFKPDTGRLDERLVLSGFANEEQRSAAFDPAALGGTPVETDTLHPAAFSRLK